MSATHLLQNTQLQHKQDHQPPTTCILHCCGLLQCAAACVALRFSIRVRSSVSVTCIPCCSELLQCTATCVAVQCCSALQNPCEVISSCHVYSKCIPHERVVTHPCVWRFEPRCVKSFANVTSPWLKTSRLSRLASMLSVSRSWHMLQTLLPVSTWYTCTHIHIYI